MARMSPHTVGLASVLVAVGASVWILAGSRGPRTAVAGFWFESVSFQSTRLGGPISATDLHTISSMARAEIIHAFAGLNVTVSDRRDAPYRVQVVQEVRDPRTRRDVKVAGQSRGVPGVGGYGTVNFSFFASGAMVYAPDTATRDALIEAIGRGIGRGAVHELTHQLLPKAPLHAGRDMESYEYYSGARPQQFFGDMRWGVAGPLLRERWGR
jgi:hypothetical protein